MGTGVARPSEGRRTVWMPLSGLLEKAAGAATQLTTRKTNALLVRRKRPMMVAGGWVVVVRQGVVRRVVLLGRLQALAGWCIPGQGHRSLRVGLVGSSSSCSHLRSTREVGTTRSRLELARCKSLWYRRKSRRRMRQRVLRGLKQQGQRLGTGCEYLMMIRPRWTEAHLRRCREVP